jgi:hypothetical protein
VDSHNHSPYYGALTAVSSTSSAVSTIATYLSDFFPKQFGLSQTITLQMELLYPGVSFWSLVFAKLVIGGIESTGGTSQCHCS